MSKRKDVFNSPEYRHIEEHLDEILNELEGDEETRDMTMPEAWDQDFREVLERVKKEKKQRHRRRFCRTLAAAAAAVIVLVPVIGFVGPETVEGDGIMELFEKNIFMNGRRYGMSGTDEEGLMIDSQDLKEIIFSVPNMKALNSEIDEVIKHPFFKVNWVPESFEVREAVYNKEYDVFNVELHDGENYIYISQQTVGEIGGQSNVTQDEKVNTILNENLGKRIDIYRSLVDKGMSFTIVYKNTRLDCYAETSIENCEMMVENIEYN